MKEGGLIAARRFLLQVELDPSSENGDVGMCKLNRGRGFSVEPSGNRRSYLHRMLLVILKRTSPKKHPG